MKLRTGLACLLPWSSPAFVVATAIYPTPEGQASAIGQRALTLALLYMLLPLVVGLVAGLLLPSRASALLLLLSSAFAYLTAEVVSSWALGSVSLSSYLSALLYALLGTAMAFVEVVFRERLRGAAYHVPRRH